MRRAALLCSAAFLALLPILAQASNSGGPGPGVAVSSEAYDISYPQCGVKAPSGGSTGIVGITGGLPWSSNACLAAEFRRAAARPKPAQLYMNTSNPETASSHWYARVHSGPRVCANAANPSDLGCAYNYGWNAAADAMKRARAAIGKAAVTHSWWLDVETDNSWNGTTAANVQDLQASVDYLRRARVPGVGFYSTSYQWSQITGGWHPAAGRFGAPSNWLAGADNAAQARLWCSPASGFSGGRVRMVQYISGAFDADYVC